MFLLVPAYPGCPGSKAVKRSLLLLLLYSIFRFYGTRLIFLTFGFISAKLTDLPGRTCPEDLFYSQLVVKLNSVIVFTYS